MSWFTAGNVKDEKNKPLKPCLELSAVYYFN